MLQQNLGKFDTHAPAAGELGAGAVEVLALEAESDDGAVHLGDVSRLLLRVLVVEDLQDILAEGAPVDVHHHLRQVADSEVGIARDTPRRGLLDARKQFEQRGFARAVLADKGDAVLRVDEEGDVVQDRA